MEESRINLAHILVELERIAFSDIPNTSARTVCAHYAATVALMRAFYNIDIKETERCSQ